MLITPHMINEQMKSKANVEVMNCSGKPLQKVIDLDETPLHGLRHACTVQNAIGLLNNEVCNFETPNGLVNVEFFLCRYCGRLYYNREQIKEQLGGGF